MDRSPFRLKGPRTDEGRVWDVARIRCAFRSAQLSRQLGAALLTNGGDIIAVGTNEVPRAGGAQYWERDRYDKRDHKLGEDSNDVFKKLILIEALKMSHFSALDHEANAAGELLQFI